MASNTPAVEGSVQYNFEWALKALSDSVLDCQEIVTKWAMIADADTAATITITLSSGVTEEVPNVAKIIQMLKSRTGDVTASRVSVSDGTANGTKVLPYGTDTGTTSGGRLWDGTGKEQHAYSTPFNTYYDMGFFSGDAFTANFFELPRFIEANENSPTVDGSHTLNIRPPKATDKLLQGRRNLDRACLSVLVRLVNHASTTRTVHTYSYGTSPIAGPDVLLAPGESRELLIWAWAGADAVNISIA